jgi:predicted TIM-barrel fold metal-dependent hydrolase
MRGLHLALALASAFALGGANATPPPVRYIDAHSHFNSSVAPAEIVARMRAAGLAGVVIMHPETTELAAAADSNPGFVVPFVSVARIPSMRGLRLSAATATTMAALQAQGAVCGLGEIPTRIEPRSEPDDATALFAPDRQAIYALAAARRVPVNLHISLSSPATIAAVETLAARYRRAPIILAHAGWEADAALVGRLMAAHPNLYADLSMRLEHPARAVAELTRISIVGADGRLKPDWAKLIVRRKDRFMFGLDISGEQRTGMITSLVADGRAVLGHLPRLVEEAVAHGTIERLTGRCGRRARASGPA